MTDNNIINNASKSSSNKNNNAAKNPPESKNNTLNSSLIIKNNSSKNSPSKKINPSKKPPNTNRNSSKYTTSSKSKVAIAPPNKMNLFPILFIVAVLPLIMRLTPYTTPLNAYPWFTETNEYFDFFLYYKQIFFLIISGIMVLIIALRAYQNKKLLNFIPIFAPLAIYALLAIISSVISQYRMYSFTGNFEQHESLFALLGYMLVVYYIYLFVHTEQDIRLIINGLLFCAIILGCIGLTQVANHDFFSTDFGWRLVTPRIYWDSMQDFTFTFANSNIYLTLFNPNYVGSYVALVAPVPLILMLFTKKPKLIIIYCIAFLVLIISLIGSKSASGLIGISIGILLALFLLRRYILKYIRIVAPIISLIIIAVLIFNGIKGNIIGTAFSKLVNIQKTEYALTEIQTNDDDVAITYLGNTMKIKFLTDEQGLYTYDLKDDNDQAILAEYSPTENGACTIQDARFPGFSIYPFLLTDTNTVGFSVTIDGYEWSFTNQTDDGTYYYFNQYMRLDKIVTAPSAIFTGYENYASSRGYLWAKTLPLLKDYMLLGSGADTYSLVFPQSDYVAAYNVGMTGQLVTKPHNMYLQTAVQTGVVSLLAFLIFYGMYFISSIRLYRKGRFTSYYSQVGIAILVGTFGYMICNIANDSTITVAPVFWVLIGLGIAVNAKTKPFIMEEDALAKAAKVSSEIQE
ncbi:MAG: O-antigen ligase family protein [Mobilitalea sp.]